MIAATSAVLLPGGTLLWSLSAVALLRATNMPVQLLERLATPAVCVQTEQAQRAQEAVAAARQQFLTELWPAALAAAQQRLAYRDPAFKLLYGVHKTVERTRPLSPDQAACWQQFGVADWPARWAGLLTTAHSSAAALEHGYQGAVTYARQQLRAAYDDPLLQQAVFLSNPDFFGQGLRLYLSQPRAGADNGRRRATEATAHRYLSRFCVKCETTSFFGPVLFAVLDPVQPAALTVGSPQPEVVFVEASSGVIEQLDRMLTEQLPLALRRPRRNPLFTALDEQTLQRALDGRRLRISRPAMQLWRAADGATTLGELGARLALNPTELAGLVRALGPTLIVALDVPATELHPLDALAAQDEASGPASRLRALRDQFAVAPWPERRAVAAAADTLCETLALPLRQHAGQHYADRTVFHEDRASPLSGQVVVGQAALRGLSAALDAVLPLCFLGAFLAREDAREALRGVLDGQPQPLVALAARALPEHRPRVGTLEVTLAQLVRQQPPVDGVVLLSSDQIMAATAAWWDQLPAMDQLACLPSPDLMAVGHDLADATWLLSELHDDASSIFGGFVAALHPNPAQLWQTFVDDVVQIVDPERMATIVSRRRTKHVTPELPGLAIELTGRSIKPRVATVPIAEVLVEPDATALRIGSERRLLYPGDLAAPVHRALSLLALTPVPIELGHHTPRIQIGPLIYQRARWRLALPPAVPGLPFWQQLHALRLQHGLPRRVFVRHPAEAKPLYLDFADPLAVDNIGRLPPATVLITEMLPTPEQLWWRPQGLAECAELRLGCFVTYRRR